MFETFCATKQVKHQPFNLRFFYAFLPVEGNISMGKNLHKISNAETDKTSTCFDLNIVKCLETSLKRWISKANIEKPTQKHSAASKCWQDGKAAMESFLSEIFKKIIFKNSISLAFLINFQIQNRVVRTQILKTQICGSRQILTTCRSCIINVGSQSNPERSAKSKSKISTSQKLERIQISENR